MNEKQALRVLRAHNRWRRFEDGGTGKMPAMIAPQKVGQAIDIACRVIVEHEAAMKALAAIAAEDLGARGQRLAAACLDNILGGRKGGAS